jgi:hypothetical protein
MPPVSLISMQNGVLITWTVATLDECGSHGKSDLGNIFSNVRTAFK